MSSLCPSSFSTIQVFNPSHRLNVRDLPKIPLSGGKVGMPHNHLADDFYRGTGLEAKVAAWRRKSLGRR